MLGCRPLLAASVRVCELRAGGCGGSGYGKAAQLLGIDGGIEGTTEPLYGALASGGSELAGRPAWPDWIQSGLDRGWEDLIRWGSITMP